MSDTSTELRETVRARYGAATQAGGGSCCGPAVATTDASGTEVFGAALYDSDQAG